MLRTTILFASLLALTGGIAPAHHVHVIVIDKMTYGPMPTGVRAGDIIEWINKDILEHSATARDGHFDVDLKPGTSGRITTTASTLVFFCKFHPTMTGTVVVK